MNETLTRTLSGAVYIAIIVACSLFPWALVGVFGIFLILAVLEFCRMVQLPSVLSVLISLPLYLLLCFLPTTNGLKWTTLALSVTVLIRLVFWLLSVRPKTQAPSERWINLIGYIVLPVAIITWIPFTETGFNPFRLLGIFILIWANDTFAFLIGKGFGKRKLLERISPKKTVEGFVGGWIMAMAFSVPVAIFLVKEAVFMWIGIATLASFSGTLGDLVESKFKRLAGVKDSGNIMPGHGGILDRLDSIIFVAPFVFLFYQILPHVS